MGWSEEDAYAFRQLQLAIEILEAKLVKREEEIARLEGQARATRAWTDANHPKPYDEVQYAAVVAEGLSQVREDGLEGWP